MELNSSDGDSWQTDSVPLTETTSPANTVGFYATRIGEDIRMTWSLGGIQVRQSD